MNDKGIIGGVVVLLLVVGGILFAVSGGGSGSGASAKNAPAGALELAQCLKDSGATFYGAFWCPHCKQQKDLFGSANKALPYVECSTPDGKNQNALCIEKKIDSYPTWEFASGERVTGEQSLETLAKLAQCPLNGVVPASDSASTTLELPAVPTDTLPAGLPQPAVVPGAKWGEGSAAPAEGAR